jgi:hypothetical protein
MTLFLEGTAMAGPFDSSNLTLILKALPSLSPQIPQTKP